MRGLCRLGQPFCHPLSDLCRQLNGQVMQRESGHTADAAVVAAAIDDKQDGISSPSTGGNPELNPLAANGTVTNRALLNW